MPKSKVNRKHSPDFVERMLSAFLQKRKAPKKEKIESSLPKRVVKVGSVVCGANLEHEILSLENKKPFLLTGYVDASSLYREDSIEILIYVTINGVEGLYAVHEQKGADREKIISFSSLVIPEKVRVCVKQTIGVGKKINYLFLIG